MMAIALWKKFHTFPVSALIVQGRWSAQTSHNPVYGPFRESQMSCLELRAC